MKNKNRQIIDFYDTSICNSLEEATEKLKSTEKLEPINREELQKTTKYQKEHGYGMRNSTLPKETIDTDDEFGEILPIEETLCEVDPLPIECLPNNIQEYVKQEAKYLSCPPDFIAMPMLTILGSLIGAKVVLKPKKNDNWIVPANNYCVILGSPSSKKTPSLSKATNPLIPLDNKLKEKYETETKQYKINFGLNKPKSKETESNAGKRPFQEPDEPTRLRLMLNDSTVEKIAVLNGQNPNGILLIKDEVVSIIEKCEKPGYESDRAFYLEGWNGLNSYLVTRISRKDTEIPNLTLSIVGASQIAKFKKYVGQALSGNCGADGLTSRFQLMVQPDDNDEYHYYDEPLNKNLCRQIEELYDFLYFMNPIEFGAKQEDHIKLPYLEFDSYAYEIFKEWLINLENSLKNDCYDPAINAHFGKYRRLIPSLCLIIHLAEKNRGQISVATLKKALGLSEYLKKHAFRIYNYALKQEIDVARTILKKITEKSLESDFTLRDINRKNWAGTKDKEVIQKALDTLTEKNYIMPRTSKSDFGGPPTTKYIINPKIFNNKGIKNKVT